VASSRKTSPNRHAFLALRLDEHASPSAASTPPRDSLPRAGGRIHPHPQNDQGRLWRAGDQPCTPEGDKETANAISGVEAGTAHWALCGLRTFEKEMITEVGQPGGRDARLFCALEYPFLGVTYDFTTRLSDKRRRSPVHDKIEVIHHSDAQKDKPLDPTNTTSTCRSGTELPGRRVPGPAVRHRHRFHSDEYHPIHGSEDRRRAVTPTCGEQGACWS
jgi:hypothetical protein